MPRQAQFFDFFDAQSEKIIEGCKALADLLENPMLMVLDG